MNKQEKNPLWALVSEDSINYNELTKILQSYVTFIDKGQISFSPAFVGLDVKRKVLISLLAVKGRSILFKEYQDRTGPLEISKMTSIKIGSVKPALTYLFSDNLIGKDKLNPNSNKSKND